MSNKVTYIDTIISIIVGILSILTYLGIKGKREKKSKAQAKQIDIKFQIDGLIKELQEDFKDRKIIPTLAVLSNGGSKISYESPMYIQALNSTNKEVIYLWGQNKTFVVPTIAKAIREMYGNGIGKAKIEKVELEKVKDWAGAEEINQVHYFLVGHKGNKTFVLAVNDEHEGKLSDIESTKCSLYAAKIKKLMNDNKKWYNKKIT